MISKVKYDDIDFQKYEQCLEKSVQRNFYATKFNLDHLSERWELLIKGDYEYVMPIPLTKKYGFKFVMMPLFCQQLGVFGKDDNKIINESFLDFLIQNYRVAQYSFNFHNLFNSDLKLKKNYFIPKTTYKSLHKNYFKGRKSTVKSSQNLILREINLLENLNFIKNHFKGLSKIKDLEKFIRYLHFLSSQEILRIDGAFYENKLLNISIIIDYKDSYSLLGLINNENYKKYNGASFLIDQILQQNIEEKSFNFMGGSLRGIEVFFKSFGSELQEYAVVENSKKDLAKTFLRKY